jgi:hypothetical protein
VVLIVGVLQAVLPESVVRYLCAVVLGIFGLTRLVRARHPRWVGMRVNARDLTAWSFLMATAHGAGLMLFPLLVGLPAGGADHSHALPSLAASSVLTDVAAVGVHTASMAIAMGVVAVLVYDKLGLGVLRRAWLNLDRVWATALAAAGAVSLFT